eukprot:scaffold3410_cov141-Cylindrotheca_fusiformis.AAC.27
MKFLRGSALLVAAASVLFFLVSPENNVTVGVDLLDVLQDDNNNNNKKSPDQTLPNVDGDDLRTWLKHRLDSLELNNDPQIRPLIIQNFVSHGISLRKKELVLATHLSTYQFDSLLLQLKYWNGPASVAVYIGNLDDIHRFIDFIETHPNILQNTSFHLALERTSELSFPTNILRKIAMEAVESEYIVAMDVEFVPLPANCHDQLTTALTPVQNKNLRTLKKMYILPAFSMTSLLGGGNSTQQQAAMLPTSKEQAVKMVEDGTLEPYSSPVERNKEDHQRIIQYDTWLKGPQEDPFAYSISISVEESKEFEPNVVGLKLGFPRYWEGTKSLGVFVLDVDLLCTLTTFIVVVVCPPNFIDFRGGEKDKISFFYESLFSGFQYRVLYPFYTIRVESLAPSEQEEPKNKVNPELVSRNVWEEFLKYISVMYDSSPPPTDST